MLSCAPLMPKGESILVPRTSPLHVDVSELLRHPGSTRDLRFHGSIDGLSVPMSHVESERGLDFDLRLEALVDGIGVSGTVAGEVQMQCSRCLIAITKPMSVEIDELFLAQGEVTEGEQAYEIQREMIDLEPAVRDAVILALPLNPLCGPDCLGLCATCGADRNETECGHEHEVKEGRWSALEQLRRTMEE